MRNPLRSIGILASIALAVTPGSYAGPFLDGLPLSPFEIMFLAALGLVLTASDWYKNRKRRLLYIGLLVTLIIIKYAGSLSLPAGWSVCLQREIKQETLLTPCEPSAQYRSGVRTYVYPEIDFAGDNTPLHFMNELAFNYKNDEEQDRHTMPYSLRASAFFKPAHAQELHIKTNTDDTYVILNGERQVVPLDVTTRIALPADEQTFVEIGYTTHHSDATSLSIESPAVPYYQAGGLSRAFIPAYKAAAWTLLLLVGLMILFESFRLLAAVPVQVRSSLLLAAAFGGILLVVKPELPSVFAAGIFGIAFVYLHYTPREQARVRPFFLLFLLLYSMAFVSHVTSYDELAILAGGDDPLTHEAHARSVFKAQSLREMLEAGTKNIFYYQPLYRYLAGGIHVLLGESLWSLFIVQTYLLTVTLFIAAGFLWRIGGSLSAGLFGVGTTYVFTHPHSWPDLALTVYQEALGLPLLLLGFMGLLFILLRQHYSSIALCGAGVLLGAAVMVRTDWLPIILLLVPAIYLITRQKVPAQEHIRTATALLAGTALFPFLILVRNILIADAATIFTTSGYINLLPPLQRLFASREEFSFLHLAVRAGRQYAAEPLSLASLLWENIRGSFIGYMPWQETGWLLVTLCGAAAIIQKNSKRILLAVILLIFVFLPMFFGSPFLQDNALAATAQYNFLLVFGISYFISLLLPQYKQALQKLTLWLMHLSKIKNL